MKNNRYNAEEPTQRVTYARPNVGYYKNQAGENYQQPTQQYAPYDYAPPSPVEDYPQETYPPVDNQYNEEYDEEYDDEYDEEEWQEQRRANWRAAAAVKDFFSTVIGCVLILGLIGLLAAIFSWVRGDLLQSFGSIL